jgi:DNA-binding MarR family transcriptional regulator
LRKARKKRRLITQLPNYEQVGYLCRRVMQASLRDLQETVPDLDVTIGQMGTLVLIACNPGITPTEICRAQGHEKPTITASLDALVRKKLVIRKPSKTDRRSFSVYLTPRGKAFYEEITPHVKQSDRRLTRVLSDAERGKLIEYLMRIYVNECADSAGDVLAGMISKIIPKGSRAARRAADRNGAARAARGPARSEVIRHLNEIDRSSAKLRKVMGALG